MNFAFGSAEIPHSEYRKVRQIARAMEQLLRRRRNAVFLIEGHTDAVGSAASNQILSERRAEALKRVLVQEFLIPYRALETVGYGEEYGCWCRPNTRNGATAASPCAASTNSSAEFLRRRYSLDWEYSNRRPRAGGFVSRRRNRVSADTQNDKDRASTNRSQNHVHPLPPRCRPKPQPPTGTGVTTPMA
ncbi:MAG: OmpA family protein [Thermomicrobiales bacterium]